MTLPPVVVREASGSLPPIAESNLIVPLLVTDRSFAPSTAPVKLTLPVPVVIVVSPPSVVVPVTLKLLFVVL